MKTKIFTLLLLFVVGGLISCENKQDDVWLSNSGGKLSITKIVNPADYEIATDSAYIDKWIKIYGTNLRSVTSIKFNDETVRIPQDVTIVGECIYIKIPYALPANITNELVLSNGKQTVSAPLKLGIPALEVLSADCEYLNAGSTMVINGNYFDLYGLTANGGKVRFGTVDAPISAASKSAISVVIPNGVAKNAVMTLVGNVQRVCPWRYQQTDHMIMDFESQITGDTPPSCSIDSARILEKGHATFPTLSSIAPLGGNKYLRVNYHALGNYNRIFKYSGYDIPTDLATNPKKYAVKFEICTVEPLKVPFDFELGDYKRYQYGKEWATSPLNTHGKWITLSIPLSEWGTGAGNSTGVFYFMINYDGTYPGYVDFMVDNFRVVPIN